MNNTVLFISEKPRHGSQGVENLDGVQFNKPNPMAKKPNLFLVH